MTTTQGGFETRLYGKLADKLPEQSIPDRSPGHVVVPIAHKTGPPKI